MNCTPKLVFDNYFSITSDTHTYSIRQDESYQEVPIHTNTRLITLRSTGPSVWMFNIPIADCRLLT